MQIKYLKPAPNATTGDIKDIATAQAVILIKLGFAEHYNENKHSNGGNGKLFNESNQDEPNQEEVLGQDVVQDETTIPKKRTKKDKDMEAE